MVVGLITVSSGVFSRGVEGPNTAILDGVNTRHWNGNGNGGRVLAQVTFPPMTQMCSLKRMDQSERETDAMDLCGLEDVLNSHVVHVQRKGRVLLSSGAQK